MNILVVGSINMDLVINTPQMPKMGETLLGSGFLTVPGGKGANQAIACGKLGGQVRLIGCVGDDIYGQECLDNLHRSNVDTSSVEMLQTNTGIAVITVCEGDNCIILDPGANKEVTKELVMGYQKELEWAEFIVLQLEIPMETVWEIVDYSKAHHKKVILNPAPMCSFDLELIRGIDLFIPNQTEAGTILDREINTIEEAKAAVIDLARMGVKTPIITLGALGCVYYDKENVYHKEAVKVTPIDTTAAGDSFIGGLCVCLARGESLKDAIEFATLVSAITVTRQGASISIPTLDEVEVFRSRSC